MADDSFQRKKQAENYLNSLGIRVNEYLPEIGDETDIDLRTPQETARRCIVLMALVGVAYGADKKRVADWLQTEGLWDEVSPREVKIFKAETLDKQTQINASWRSETLFTLLWAMNKADELELPVKQCDSNFVVNTMPQLDASCADFIESASLRAKAEILYQTELIYQIHWAVRDAYLNKREIPGKFIPSVVSERHFALNWLTYYEDKWDEITTDT